MDAAMSIGRSTVESLTTTASGAAAGKAVGADKASPATPHPDVMVPVGREGGAPAAAGTLQVV